MELSYNLHFQLEIRIILIMFKEYYLDLNAVGQTYDLDKGGIEFGYR